MAWLWTALEVASLAAIVLGVALWSIPAACITFGVLGIGSSWLVNRR